MMDERNYGMVKMPWDCTRRVFDEDENCYCTRWELIKKKLGAQIHTVDQLINIIKSYNTYTDASGAKILPNSNFQALREVIENMEPLQRQKFFEEDGVLQSVRNLVRTSFDVVPKVSWLLCGKQSSFQLHQLQVACILANLFFCTFPVRENNQPSFDCFRLFHLDSPRNPRVLRRLEKIRCLLHYFWRIYEKQPTGYISFHRRCIQQADFPRWEKTSAPLTSLTVEADGRIEEAKDYLQMDFANRVIGGGVLNTGCVQEEIRFIICPDLIAARLFSEPMAENEAIIIIGSERYCSYTGYGDNFRFTGDYVDTNGFDDRNRRMSYVLAVDATSYRNPQEQYKEGRILRELKKAYTGLRPMSVNKSPRPLATGNWGCGVYRGDPQLKSLLLLMAASQAGRDITYFTFGNEELKRDLEEIYASLRSHSINVGQLYRILVRYNRERVRDQTVYQFVAEALYMKSSSNAKLFSYLSTDELTAMENGQKRKKLAVSSSLEKEETAKNSHGSETSKLWFVTEKKTANDVKIRPSSSVSDPFRNGMTISSTTAGRLSPSMFPDDDNSDCMLSESDTPSPYFSPLTPVKSSQVINSGPTPRPPLNIFETCEDSAPVRIDDQHETVICDSPCREQADRMAFTSNNQHTMDLSHSLEDLHTKKEEPTSNSTGGSGCKSSEQSNEHFEGIFSPVVLNYFDNKRMRQTTLDNFFKK